MVRRGEAKGRSSNKHMHKASETNRHRFPETAGTAASESATCDSEARYRRLFQTAQDGILILDAETGEITDVNPFLASMLGYSHREFLGKKLWEVGPFGDIFRSREKFLELQKKGYVRHADLPLETKQGKTIEVEFVSNSYRVDHTKVIQCNIRNITGHKRLETSLRNANRIISMVRNCNQAMVRARSEKELLERVCRIIVESGDTGWHGSALQRKPGARWCALSHGTALTRAILPRLKYPGHPARGDGARQALR